MAKSTKNSRLKWLNIIILIVAALTISLEITTMPISFLIFLIGHIMMVILMIQQKEWQLVIVNIIWSMIDILGIINHT
jgi:hypothetical protein